MKELANSLAQLVAIIMILITLAVSSAAISQWASAADNSAATNANAQPQTFIATSAK
jgi:F0F1-type ATP synthase membrane subunit c/vacuolar-type H+-ATPase subunit K